MDNSAESVPQLQLLRHGCSAKASQNLMQDNPKHERITAKAEGHKNHKQITSRSSKQMLCIQLTITK
jgi:hypothetical protein